MAGDEFKTELDIGSTNTSASNLRRQFDISRGNAGQNTKQEPAAAAFETSVGQDIGNFFKVLMHFLGGLFKGDFSDFELYSSVYFPPTPKEKQTEEQKDYSQRVEKMHVIHKKFAADPEKKVDLEVMKPLTEGLPEAKLQQDPRKIILDAIAKVESSDNYNVVYGGKKMALTSMTIAEVLEWQKENSQVAQSSAAGRYQLMSNTLKDMIKEHNIDVNAKFDASMQDKLANHLLDRRGFNDYMTGKLPLTDFMINLSKEWAALPKDDSNLSYYHGDGLNKSRISANELREALLAAKEEITTREFDVFPDTGTETKTPAPTSKNSTPGGVF